MNGMHIKTIPQPSYLEAPSLLEGTGSYSGWFWIGVWFCLLFFGVFYYLKFILCTEKIQTLTVTVLKLFTIIFIFMETQDDIASPKNSFWLPILT